MSWDVIIVGAGVVGALTARELSRYDLRVLVLEAEPDVAMGATKANSAIVHGGFAEGRETLKGQLCLPGRLAFAQLESELNFGYRVTGSLVLNFDADASRLEALHQKGLANGVPDLELWCREQVLEHEPHVNPSVTGALWCAGAGVCSPWDLAIAALENAVTNGVDLRLNQRVASVEPPIARGGLWTLVTGDERYETRWVINAAGAAGGLVDQLAGLSDTTLQARTGEYLVFAAGTGSLVNSVLFQLPGPLGKGVLVGPTYQNNLLIGPDAVNEQVSPTDVGKHTHEERLAALVAQASRMVGGLDLKKAIRSFTGVRAASPTGDFVIGAANQATHPGWHRAVGIQSPGLTSSPAIALQLVQGLEAEGLELRPREGFNPHRRALPVHLSRRAPLRPFAEAEALTKLDSHDPHRLVCRCEQVSQADLAEALERGIPCATIDAVKRRTRAGMGWCQGRFCRPRVAAWLEERTGHPFSVLDDAQRSGWHRVEGRDLWSLKKE